MKNIQSHQRMVNKAQALKALFEAAKVLDAMDPNGITDMSDHNSIGVMTLVSLNLVELLPDNRAMVKS